MAARKHLSHDDKTRARIQTSQLINRLESCALGDLELSPSKLKSIEILLKKSLPDLSAIQITGEMDHRTVTKIELVAPGA